MTASKVVRSQQTTANEVVRSQQRTANEVSGYLTESAVLAPPRGATVRSRVLHQPVQAGIRRSIGGFVALLAVPLFAQSDAELARGTAVYNRSCATGYCHGLAGSPGSSAPGLAGRNLPISQITKATLEGVPGTPMPGWKTLLPEPDLKAVIAYVIKLSAEPPAPVRPPRPPRAAKRPPEIQRGRDLFFDATRGAQRCGTCHVSDGWGTPIGPELKGVTADLKAIVSKNTATAKMKSGESFPVLLIAQTKEMVRVYDLSSALPVLRTLSPGDVEIVPGSLWTHAAATANYTSEELAAIAPFLKSAK